ncbi:hypothetical protein [Pseudooceanicola onchidii]|uniref:hypothetical protein n=1 Tax=Pseudooceanicola onchidii TaxID=2562279 RepID=UPI001980BA37|nr:hypothetical protein [Pseudooceanicola onchidii]
MKKLFITAGFGLLAMAAPAAADAKLFPYPAKANYCPEGLQPIQMGGVICCGVPNQSVTYSQYQAHPAPRRVYRAQHWDGSKSPQGWDGSKSPRY